MLKFRIFGNSSSDFLKNPDIFLRKCQKYVEELKFCMNELFNNVFKVLLFLIFEKFTLDLSDCGKFTRALLAHQIFRAHFKKNGLY
jgi:hypothetical protein